MRSKELRPTDSPKTLNAEAFKAHEITHETAMPMTVEALREITIPTDKAPYQAALKLLENKEGGEKLMVDSGLVIAALARSFEEVRAEIEVNRNISPSKI